MDLHNNARTTVVQMHNAIAPRAGPAVDPPLDPPTKINLPIGVKTA